MLCIVTYLSWNPEITCTSIFNSQRKKNPTVPDKLQYSAKINQDAYDPPSVDYKQESKTQENVFHPPIKGITTFPDHHFTFLLTNPSANPSPFNAAIDKSARELTYNFNIHARFL